MRRQRPAPITVPAPPNLSTSHDLLSPASLSSSYLAPPPPSTSPVNSFFLRLKRSASQLRPGVSTSTLPPSPKPSPLLSAAVFPLPPSREDEDSQSRPFANLAPRSPTTGQKPWLDVPSPSMPPLSATSSTISSTSSDKWPLTPDTPYTPLKEHFSPSRHGKDLIFPHKARSSRSSTPVASPKRYSQVDDDSDVDVAALSAPGAPRIPTLPLPFPSPPRSPKRNGILLPPSQTPKTPPPRPRSHGPSPPPTRALPPIPTDNALGLRPPPSTPPKSLRSTPRQAPTAPKPQRIFSTYPYASTISPRRTPAVHFPDPPSRHRPRTPFPPNPRPASPSSSTDEENSSADLSTSTAPSSVSSTGSKELHYPSPPEVFLVASLPPPRPPRSPLRPTSRPVSSYTLQPAPSLDDDDDDDASSTYSQSTLESVLDEAVTSRRAAAEERLSTPPRHREKTIHHPHHPYSLSPGDSTASSLGSISEREYYHFLGFPRARYGVIAGLSGDDVPAHARRVGGGGDAGPKRRRDRRRIDLDVEFEALPAQVRESMLRLSLDAPSPSSLAGRASASAKEDEAKEELVEDEFVMQMMEKMLWG
ncbi:hypothetical protein JCM1840_003120 [Sporobolomyces johnsonii]